MMGWFAVSQRGRAPACRAMLLAHSFPPAGRSRWRALNSHSLALSPRTAAPFRPIRRVIRPYFISLLHFQDPLTGRLILGAWLTTSKSGVVQRRAASPEALRRLRDKLVTGAPPTAPVATA
jgi:hypothetical protein